jgi:hypothetical protein
MRLKSVRVLESCDVPAIEIGKTMTLRHSRRALLWLSICTAASALLAQGQHDNENSTPTVPRAVASIQ